MGFIASGDIGAREILPPALNTRPSFITALRHASVLESLILLPDSTGFNSSAYPIRWINATTLRFAVYMSSNVTDSFISSWSDFFCVCGLIQLTNFISHATMRNSFIQLECLAKSWSSGEVCFASVKYASFFT